MDLIEVKATFTNHHDMIETISKTSLLSEDIKIIIQGGKVTILSDITHLLDILTNTNDAPHRSIKNIMRFKP